MLNFTILGGVADRVGGLKRGDQLLSVNGVSVEGENHEKAVELLKAAIGSVKLVVRLELWLCYKTTNNFQTVIYQSIWINSFLQVHTQSPGRNGNEV